MKTEKPMGHYRLASRAMGDDTTRARYVRTAPAEAPGHGRKRRVHKPRLPGMEAAFIQEGRTKFGKGVKRVSEMKNLLVSGHDNIKIGRDVRTGKVFDGYWIYTLSLEERKTCPSSCQHWQSCYGNNMPFAKRIQHDDPEFLPRLEAEIAERCAVRGRKGILIRLHALGDFFSVGYVHFWRKMLARHSNLAIYGYTAHPPGKFDAIADEIAFMNHCYSRSMIRFSNGGLGTMSTVSIGNADSCPPNAFICPEQTGKRIGCDACGACWQTKTNVAFLEH